MKKSHLTQAPARHLFSEIKPGQSSSISLSNYVEYKCIELPCHLLCLGNYNIEPKYHKLTISNRGIQFYCPCPVLPTRHITLFIGSAQVVKIYARFRETDTVLILMMRPSTTIILRDNLGIHDRDIDDHKFLNWEKPPRNYIYLFLDNIENELKEEAIKIINDWHIWLTLVQMSEETASQLMNRTFTETTHKKELAYTTFFKTRTSTGNNLMIYPPPPTPGGIKLTIPDYKRLGQSRFLNDSIINFYMKYLEQNIASQIKSNGCHFFEPFFYTRLTSPMNSALYTSEDDPKLSPAEKRHCRVVKWTKKTNIFQKDFVFIPINENADHWLLVVICFPGIDGARKYSDLKVPVNEPPTLKAPLTAQNVVDLVTRFGSLPFSRDEAEADPQDFIVEADFTLPRYRIPHKRVNGRAVRLEPIKQPLILLYDSLFEKEMEKEDLVKYRFVVSRARIISTLREYLTCEYSSKYPEHTKEFTVNNMPVNYPRVPQQPNLTDCGLFVLQNAETFLKRPYKNYRVPVFTPANWFTQDEIVHKREMIGHLIRHYMLQQNIALDQVPYVDFPHPSEKMDWSDSSAD